MISSTSHVVLPVEVARTLAVACAERIRKFREQVAAKRKDPEWIENTYEVYKDVMDLTELLRKAYVLWESLEGPLMIHLSLTDLNTLLATCKD